MSWPSAFRSPAGPLAFGPLASGPAIHYHALPGAQRSNAAGRISHPVHSGLYPIRFQNGADSGFICA